MKLVSSQLYVFWHSKMVAGPCNLKVYLPSTAIRTRGYVNNARNLPTSRSQRTQGRNIPVQGNPSLRYTFFSPPIVDFVLYVCATTIFLVRFLRIHPVQSVINNPTQLSEEDFPTSFTPNRYCHNFTFVWCSQMEAGPCILIC